MNESNHSIPNQKKRTIKSIVVESIVAFAIIIFMIAITIPAIESARKSSSRHTSLNNMRNIGLAITNYASTPGESLPMGGATDRQGRQLHGWMTSILPFLDAVELAKQINYEKPWNAPENKTVFQTQIRGYQNPDIHSQVTNLEGYALAHYTANSRVFGINQSTSMNHIARGDGLSSTIILGEINANYPAWGAANNIRDPAKGLHGGPDRFGGPSEEGVAVIFADGSGGYLSKEIDPQILKALSTPDGGEQISIETRKKTFQW